MPECIRRHLQQVVVVMATVLLLRRVAGESVEKELKRQFNSTQSLDMPSTQNHNRPDPLTDHLQTGEGEKPKVLALYTTCKAEDEAYCVNGVCYYAPDLDKPSCRCKPMFSGSRCEHVIMNTYVLTSREEVIGITCGVLLLLACIALLIYCFWRKRVSKSSLPYKSSGQNNPV